MKTSARTVVWSQQGAPPKPALGAPCNGCGLCCLAAPCPLGMVVSRRLKGACAALRWDAGQQRYWCGLVSSPAEVLGWKQPWVLRLVQRVARRQIAADSGCDATIEIGAANRTAP